MDRRKYLKLISATIMTVFFLAGWTSVGLAGDLDDNINIDDNISSYDNLGNVEQNINFIKMNAKSDAKRQQRTIDKGVGGSGGGGGALGKKGGAAMNSVIMGPGSNVKGDIIIIDESKGDKSQVVE